jgi:hypothetical protein
MKFVGASRDRRKPRVWRGPRSSHRVAATGLRFDLDCRRRWTRHRFGLSRSCCRRELQAAAPCRRPEIRHTTRHAKHPSRFGRAILVILADGASVVREEKRGLKNRKGGAWQPRPPVRCRLLARSGRSVGAARPFGLSSRALFLQFPARTAARLWPWPLFNVALKRRGSSPAGPVPGSAVELVSPCALPTTPHGYERRR